jgi:hypothetical protein
MRSLSVIFILCLSFILISINEVYFGFVLLLLTFITVIKYAASSPYGDMSKTQEEIKGAIIQARKEVEVDINYLSYPEQIAMKEKYRQQGIKDRARERAQRKSKAKRFRRFYHPINTCSSSCSSGNDDFILTSPQNDMFEHDDDYFIHKTVSENDVIEETYVNPTTGMIMIGGIGGIDAGGHVWGESDSFNDSFSDSTSSFDDTTFSSFDDSYDTFTTDEGEW